MNTHSKAIEDIRQKETSSEFLTTRLRINDKYQTNDFNGWLFGHMKVAENDAVLDVGCGTGMQALRFAKEVGTGGRVCAFDISADSVKALAAAAKKENLGNIIAVTGRMEDAASIVKQFPVSEFDIIHSSYALYYAEDPLETLRTLLGYLKPGGQTVVFTPMAPHGMVNFAKKFHPVPAPVEECFLFGEKVLEPFFRKNFGEVDIHHYKNLMKVLSADDFMALYRATTYYDSASDGKIYDAVRAIIDEKGAFEFEKNGFLIVGKNKKRK